MNSPLLFLVATGLTILFVFVTGIYLSNRSEGILSNETVKEALLWGGGFIIYAIFDYFILMH
jgi:hypothetical protein